MSNTVSFDDFYKISSRRSKTASGDSRVTYRRSIALLLVKYREDEGITLQQLADRLGLTRQALIHWKTGRSDPTDEHREIVRQRTGIIIPPPRLRPPRKRRQDTPRSVKTSTDNAEFAPPIAGPYARALIADPERFAELIKDSTTFLIWRSKPDKLCDWFNRGWLEFVGRPMEQEIGNGWAENVHPDDFDRCLKTYREAFDARQPFSMMYRLRRADGDYRYILDIGAPFDRDGVFAGYYGGGYDIGEQEQAEAEFRSLLPALALP